MIINNKIYENNKQIFHIPYSILFNIRNYSPDVLILNDAKRSWILYYLGWIISILNNKRLGNISFYYMPPTPNKMWEDKYLRNTVNFETQDKSFFFVKPELQHI